MLAVINVQNIQDLKQVNLLYFIRNIILHVYKVKYFEQLSRFCFKEYKKLHFVELYRTWENSESVQIFDI